MRKYGTGEILPEDDDIKKTSTVEERERSLQEVREEQQRAAEKE
jgi:hypothetical protein